MKFSRFRSKFNKRKLLVSRTLTLSLFFENFKGLKKHKFSNAQILFEPIEKGKPEKIVAIFIRKDLDIVKKGLRPDYPTKRR